MGNVSVSEELGLIPDQTDVEENWDWLTVDLLKNCINEAKSHPTRVEFMQKHKRAWTYYRLTNKCMRPVGDGDVEMDSDETYQIAFENRIAKSVDDTGSTGLANYPIVRHFPYNDRPQDGELADNMDAITEAVWRPDGGNLANVIQTVWKEARISGLGVGKTYWDQSNQLTGNGQVAGVKIPHTELLIDPYALNDKRLLDARYIIHITKHSKGYVRARYGSEGKIALGERKAKGKKSIEGKSGRWSRFKNFMREELVNPMFGGKGGTGIDPNAKVESDLVEIYECWLSPIVASDSEVVSGNSLEQYNSQWVVATLIGDTIVKKDRNPNAELYEASDAESAMRITDEGTIETDIQTHIIGSKRHPFFCIYWEATSDDDGRNRVYCCKGAVEPMIPVQVSINALMTVIQKNALTFASPYAEVIKDSLDNVATDKIEWTPGQIFVNKPNVTRGQPAIRILEGGQLPAYIFTMLQEKMRALGEMGSFSELMTGLGSSPQMGTSHTTGSVMAGAQQAAMRPLVTPLIELERGIYDISILVEGLMQQHYEEDRIINVSNNGKQLAVKWKKALITAQFIRKVVGGSTTPISDLTKQQDVMLIDQMVKAVLMTNDKYSIISTMLALKNMGKPFAHDFIQLLGRKLTELEQLEQEQVAMGQALGQQQAQAEEMQESPQERPNWDQFKLQ